MLIANINVALQAGSVAGLPFPPGYYYIRPFLQPLIIWWVLYASGTLRGKTASR
jgi:hypothetical protein